MTPEQVAKYEARKAARVALLVRMKDAKAAAPVTGYLSVTGHAYSGRNQMFLALQACPAGSMAGFRQWLALGRKVVKGSHGFDVMFPITKKRGDADTQDADDDATFFSWTVLFHESQTEPVTA